MSTATDDWRPGRGLARAGDLLGRPWTLLIIACLADSPRRFGEIVAALPGISTNLLSERLRVLTAAAIVTRTPTSSSSTYGLTDHGEGLRPLLTDLDRWGGSLPS